MTGYIAFSILDRNTNDTQKAIGILCFYFIVDSLKNLMFYSSPRVFLTSFSFLKPVLTFVFLDIFRLIF